MSSMSPSVTWRSWSEKWGNWSVWHAPLSHTAVWPVVVGNQMVEREQAGTGRLARETSGSDRLTEAPTLMVQAESACETEKLRRSVKRKIQDWEH